MCTVNELALITALGTAILAIVAIVSAFCTARYSRKTLKLSAQAKLIEISSNAAQICNREYEKYQSFDGQPKSAPVSEIIMGMQAIDVGYYFFDNHIEETDKIKIDELFWRQLNTGIRDDISRTKEKMEKELELKLEDYKGDSTLHKQIRDIYVRLKSEF